MAMRLVVVDDNDGYREMLILACRNRGDIEVVGQAASGAEAIEVVIETRPDAVLLDQYLPDINGTAVAKVLRRTMQTLVIVLVSSGDPNEFVPAPGDVGVDAVLAKTMSPLELLAAIEKLAA